MLVDAGFLRLVADVDLKEHALHRNVFGQAAGQRFGELQVVHSVDEGETPGDVLGFVGLDVADAMPLHIEIGKGFLLGKRFLHVIFAKNPLSEPVCRENGLHWMQLGYGNETYIFRLAPRDAGGPGERPRTASRRSPSAAVSDGFMG